MYQCLKIIKVSKDDSLYWLTKFLDTERAQVFSVYTSRCPGFEPGISYELSLAPNFKGFNFLQNEI